MHASALYLYGRAIGAHDSVKLRGGDHVSVRRPTPALYMTIDIKRTAIIHAARNLHELFGVIFGVLCCSFRVSVATDPAIRHHAAEKIRSRRYLRVQSTNIYQRARQKMRPAVDSLLNAETTTKALAGNYLN